MSSAKVSTKTRDRGDRTEVVVEFELPGPVAEEARDGSGEIDPDEVSDRIRVVPVFSGEPV